MTNRYKELNLRDRVPEELWTKVYNTMQEAVIKTILKKKKCKKAKWLSEEAFSSVQFGLAAQSSLTLCDPVNRSTPCLLVHHQLPEFIQTHV